MKTGRIGWGTAAAVAVALVSLGCGDTYRGARKDTRENTETAKETTREAGDDAAETTSRAAERAASAVREAGADVDAQKQTMDIKAALLADTTIDASDIEVDTSAESRVVLLRGSVPTAAQKAAAEGVARKQAQGYTILNQLQVKPKR